MSPLCCLALFICVHVDLGGSVTGSGVGRVQDSQAGWGWGGQQGPGHARGPGG